MEHFTGMFILAFCFVFAAPAAHADTPKSQPESTQPAFFRFCSSRDGGDCARKTAKGDGDGWKNGFIVMLKKREDIDHARAILRGVNKDRRTSILGTVIASRAAYNSDWRFHLRNPQFFEYAYEACDSTPLGVESDLRNWTHTVKIWCPWQSTIVEEVHRYRPIAQLPTPAASPSVRIR